MFEGESGAREVCKVDYGNVQTVKPKVKTVAYTTESFNVKVGLHQGSALSAFLFNVVFDVLTEEERMGVPWDIMYADDVELGSESKQEVKERTDEWRTALERE